MSNKQSSPENDREGARRQRGGAANKSAGSGRVEHPLLRLQRQIGNAKIARMLAQRAAVQRQGPDEDELQMQRQGPDEDELQMQRQGPDEDELQMQRQGPDEDELQMQRQGPDEDELQMQRVVPEIGMEGGKVSDGVAQRIQSKRGGGAPLEGGMLARMEAGLGTSLGDVRLHTDAESHALNQQVGAKAFTTGSDIFLGQNASPQDSRLLGHELTHVVQQRTMDVAGPMEVTPAGDRFEQEADAVSDAINSQPASAPAQRETEDSSS